MMKLVGDFKLINIYYTPSYNSLSSSWMQIRGRDMCKVTLLTNMGTKFPALCLDSSVQKYTAPSKLTGVEDFRACCLSGWTPNLPLVCKEQFQSL